MEKANSLHYWHNLLKHLKLTLAIILRSLTHTGREEIIVYSVNIDIACYCLQIALLCFFIFVFVYFYPKYKSVSTILACGTFYYFLFSEHKIRSLLSWNRTSYFPKKPIEVENDDDRNDGKWWWDMHKKEKSVQFSRSRKKLLPIYEKMEPTSTCWKIRLRREATCVSGAFVYLKPSHLRCGT